MDGFEVALDSLVQHFAREEQPKKQPWQMTRDEFAKSGPSPIYHGSRVKGVNQLESRHAPQYGNAVYFTPSHEEASDFGHGGEVHIGHLKPDAKIWDDVGGYPEGHENTPSYKAAIKAIMEKHGPEHEEDTGRPMTHDDARWILREHEGYNTGDLQNRIVRELGYHGIRGGAHGGEIAVFDPSSVVVHRQAVAQALAAGHPVPSHVLAEYPDLIKQQKFSRALNSLVEHFSETEFARILEFSRLADDLVLAEQCFSQELQVDPAGRQGRWGQYGNFIPHGAPHDPVKEAKWLQKTWNWTQDDFGNHDRMRLNRHRGEIDRILNHPELHEKHRRALTRHLGHVNNLVSLIDYRDRQDNAHGGESPNAKLMSGLHDKIDHAAGRAELSFNHAARTLDPENSGVERMQFSRPTMAQLEFARKKAAKGQMGFDFEDEPKQGTLGFDESKIKRETTAHDGKRPGEFAPKESADKNTSKAEEPQGNLSDDLNAAVDAFEKPSRHWYGMRYRPVSIATAPKGFVETKPHESFRHGQVAYDRQLTDKEIYDYELDPIRQDHELPGLAEKVKSGLGDYADQYLDPENERLLDDRLNQEDMRKMLGHVDIDKLKSVLRGDVLHGGKADGMPDSAFQKKSLAQGKAEESEHTDNTKIAGEIAKDHLAEDPKYYDKLKKIEPNEPQGKLRQSGLYSQADLGGAPQLFDTGKEFVKEKKSASKPKPAESSLLEKIEDEHSERSKASKGLQGQKSLTDDLNDAVEAFENPRKTLPAPYGGRNVDDLIRENEEGFAEFNRSMPQEDLGAFNTNVKRYGIPWAEVSHRNALGGVVVVGGVSGNMTGVPIAMFRSESAANRFAKDFESGAAPATMNHDRWRAYVDAAHAAKKLGADVRSQLMARARTESIDGFGRVLSPKDVVALYESNSTGN